MGGKRAVYTNELKSSRFPFIRPQDDHLNNQTSSGGKGIEPTEKVEPWYAKIVKNPMTWILTVGVAVYAVLKFYKKKQLFNF